MEGRISSTNYLRLLRCKLSGPDELQVFITSRYLTSYLVTNGLKKALAARYDTAVILLFPNQGETYLLNMAFFIINDFTTFI